ncbi:heavy-metal-associated domain-containing protein [Sulfuricurvum sp.]|uniref:heavy-metal-associated domain-containing protein n=1 Tax=Sulfuricurvum sp. TaxID=2025608 RepID=UPI002E33A322|nr:heavy-metal-associated domain-containing protein [Sulfuricurvum sp.]HEX5330841.1 heavy-metal-associated domain-containing protein [Sulfuricurvum sp.]
MITVFEVANIRCGGCSNTITKALNEAGFKEVSVDLSCEPRKVTADIADDAQLAHFKAVLRNLGYPLVGDEEGTIDNAALKLKSFVSCAIGKFTPVNESEKL